MKRLAFHALVVGAALFASGAIAPAALGLGLVTGFNSDPVLTSDGPVSRAVWIPRAVSEGARLIRVNVTWSAVTPQTRPPGFSAANPASPGYDWTEVDGTIRDLTAHGLQVMLSITGAPSWAEGSDMPATAPAGSWRPAPAQYASFATAAAVRYHGHFPDPLRPGAFLPKVSYWQAWNEPNLAAYISPQWTRSRSGWNPASPGIYRQLLNAFYRAVKTVSKSNFVATAGTAPYGDPPGGERMQPVAFDRSLFCLKGDLRLTALPCPDPPHLDALSHHPYGIGGPEWHAINPDDAAVPDIYKLTRLLHAAEHDRHVLPLGPKRMWVTETSWDSNPPDPQGVPIQHQARWLEQALYVLWRQGVDTVMWLDIVDQPCVPNCATTYQAGLYYINGKPKPAATAFRFPFVTQRLNRREISAWGRAPSAGRIALEVLRRGRWTVLRRLTVGNHQVFAITLPLVGRRILRAQARGQTSLAWMQAA